MTTKKATTTKKKKRPPTVRHGAATPTPRGMRHKQRTNHLPGPITGWCGNPAATLAKLEGAKHYPLTRGNVNRLKARSGFYALYRGGYLMSIGKGQPLRRRLFQHLDSARRFGVHDLSFSVLSSPLDGDALRKCERWLQVQGGTTRRDRLNEAEDELFWFF